MKREDTISIIVILITLISAIAAGFGIFYDFGAGAFEYESIRGKTIEIFGKGIYQHMSADVAIQGIAQDYITLFVALPLLAISLIGYRKKSIKAHFLLAGTLGYFLVTYLFYLTMGMYNIMFLPYAVLLGLAFFGFFLALKELSNLDIIKLFSVKTPNKFVGWFLIINSISITFLWLSIILPPLIDGTIYPPDLNHYTTLIVQGLDLGLLLPIGFVVGVLLIRKKSSGYLYATIYVVFLSIFMTALTAKIIAMAMNDVNVIPVIFIIPSINIICIVSAGLMIKNISTMKINQGKMNNHTIQ
ncbi:MAG: hypothetical protein R6U03_01480 [Gillisia sp.]